MDNLQLQLNVNRFTKMELAVYGILELNRKYFVHASMIARIYYGGFSSPNQVTAIKSCLKRIECKGVDMRVQGDCYTISVKTAYVGVGDELDVRCESQ